MSCEFFGLEKYLCDAEAIRQLGDKMKLFVVALVMLIVPVLALADDFDGNGIDDGLEVLLARKFCPSFKLHDDRFVEPEPVEIMSATGGPLTGADLWCSFFSLTSQEWLTVNGGENLFSQPYNYVFDLEGDPIENRADGLQFVAVSEYQDILSCPGPGCMTYLHLQYGAWAEETPDDWFAEYLFGSSDSLRGSQFPPTVYAHLYLDGGQCVIQYWMFYPFNDFINDHEGDWEHINVVLSNASIEGGSVEAVDYHFHHFHASVEGDYLGKLHWADGSHPVVYVGGHGGLDPMGPWYDEGDTSGGSYPAPGMYHDVGAELPFGLGTPDEWVGGDGKYIDHEAVEVVVYPRIDRHGIAGDEDGAGEEYFSQHPDKAWMRGDFYWGQYITPMDFFSFPEVTYNTNIGNRSPRTPAYKETWEHRETADSQQFTNMGTLDDNPPMVLIKAQHEGESLPGVSVSYTFLADGVEHINSSPVFKRVSSLGAGIRVEVPSEIEVDGQILQFGKWWGVPVPDCFDPAVEITLDGFNNDVEAEYVSGHGPVWQERLDVFPDLTGSSAAWGDFNNDGLIDLFLLLDGYSGQLLRNVGGSFVSEPFPSFSGEVVSAGWGDFDGDGDLDLVLVPRDGGLVGVQLFYFENGSCISSEVVGYPEGEFGTCSVIDVNNDSLLDIVLAGDIAPWGTYWSLQNSSVFINDSQSGWRNVENLIQNSAGFAWADFDNDGFVDACSIGGLDQSGSNILKNSGSEFIPVEDFLPFLGWDRSVFSCAWIDYNQDGLLDFFVNNELFRNAGNGNYERVYNFPIEDQDTRYANWADFNYDGWADVIINGRLFRNDNGVFAELTNWIEWPQQIPGEWQWVDFDGDGDLDLFSLDSGLRLFQNTEEVSGKFLKINLHGNSSNSMGIGSIIETPLGVINYTQNSGVPTTNYNCIIGLGDWSGDFPISVIWPSGFVTEQTIEPNVTEIEISEPGIYDVMGNFSEGDIPGSIGLEFSWVTDFECTSDGFRIVFEDQYGSWQGCVAPVEELNTANCEFSQTPLGAGQWQHTVRYENIECQENCYIPFWVGVRPSDFPELEIKKSGQGIFIENCPDFAKFTDISEDTGLNYEGSPYSGNALDFNGDPHKDLLVTISDGPSHLKSGLQLLPNGSPHFANDNFFPDGNVGLRGVSAADFDNDGDEDLFVASASAPKLLRNDDGSFVDVTPSMNLNGSANESVAAAWGDFDRDGWLDLFVVRTTTFSEPPLVAGGGMQHRLFRNETHLGNGFVDVTTEAGLGGVATIGSLSASWVDIEGDGDQDLFLVNNMELPVGPGGFGCMLFVNQDDGTFNEELGERFPFELPSMVGERWMDIDNDADLDLVLCSSYYNPVIFYNDGNGYFNGDNSVAPLVAPGGHSGLQVFDHDLNGTQDLLFTPKDSQDPSRLFVTVLGGDLPVFLENTSLVGLNAPGAVLGSTAADYTNDGDCELFLGKPISQGGFFFKTELQDGSDSLGKNYVKIMLSSPYGANVTNGVGSRVILTAGTHTQIQQVDGGSGRGGQNDRELIFGLGDFSGPVTATVHWLGGNIQEDVPLIISNQSSGETINTITDDTDPAISEVSASFTVNPVTLKIDWIFSWETDVSCKASLDQVEFDQVGIPTPCWPGWTTVNPATPDVDHVYAAKQGGGYIHKLKISNQDCTPACSFRFLVSSGTDQAQVQSSAVFKRVKICPSSN